MSRFLNSRYQQLEAYTPGEQPRDMVYIKLNTNESPYPPAPEVVAAMTAAGDRMLERTGSRVFYPADEWYIPPAPLRRRKMSRRSPHFCGSIRNFP